MTILMSDIPRVLYYKTVLYGCKNAKGQECTKADAYAADGISWRWIGTTSAFRIYPQAVRARSAAATICRNHASGVKRATRAEMKLINIAAH